MSISIGIGMLLIAAQIPSGHPMAQNEQYNAANRAALEAYYKVSGAEDRIRELEKRYISKDVQESVANMMMFGRIVVEHRIELKFSW